MANLNNTYTAGTVEINPVVAHETSVAIIGYPLAVGTYAVGALVYSDVVANPSQWVLVDSTVTTNATLIAPNIKVGVISCIHDEHDCSYQEIDVDNIIHLLGDIKLNVVQHSTEAKLYQKRLTMWDGSAFVAIAQADYLAGGILEGIVEVVDASTDGDKPILKFKD